MLELFTAATIVTSVSIMAGYFLIQDAYKHPLV